LHFFNANEKVVRNYNIVNSLTTKVEYLNFAAYKYCSILVSALQINYTHQINLWYED